jgi:peptidoglycan/LPS O-acetylase OafA/YrhL
MPGVPDWLYFPVILRHPAKHLLPYLTGWLVSVHYQDIRPLLRQHGSFLLTIAIALDVLVLPALQQPRTPGALRLLEQVHVYTWLPLLMTLGVSCPTRSRVLQFLSDTSYGIYLLHFPFVRITQNACRGFFRAEFQRILLPWLTGCIVSICVIVCLRKVLGQRSRSLVGA